LKVLHLIYTSGIYGAEKHLLYLLPELKKYGIQCELLFICPKKSISSLQEYCKQMNEEGIKTALVPIPSKFSLLLTVKKIYQYLKSNHIEIIHSHLFSADLVAVLVKKIYFKKLVILSTKHGYEEKYLVQYGLGNKKIKYNLYYFISREVIKRIDHNLSVSHSLAEMYVSLKLVKGKMKFIHHGIQMNNLPEKQIQVKGYPKIMMVGRLSEIKGHTFIIRALPEIINKFPELKLLLLGEGPLKDKIIKQARTLNILDHIEFIGFASPETYSTECQLMVLPSLYESFGLVLIEAFALRIPVIAFDGEAANQIIDDNETGFLVEKGNIKLLSEKIISLLESPEERERIATNAYKKFETYYNVERMSNETAEWYYSIFDISRKKI
jgi:glycosyltransferase involved in cell wall biosynthesis